MSTPKRARKPKPDGFLVGVSREPIIIKVPGNIAAAYRAWAMGGEVDLLRAIFDTLRSGGELALDESGRDDVPPAEQKNAWLMAGAVVGEAVPLDVSAELLASATNRAKDLGLSFDEYVNALLSLHLDVQRKARLERTDAA